jgi:glycosyltransferase involved in cell wall biosynthesis
MKLSGKRVAITQNRLQKGGRLQVILAFIKVLNELGIEPDLLTMKANITQEQILEGYGQKLRFKIREILMDAPLPFEWHIIGFNFLTRFYENQYDLIINSNNTSFLTGGAVPMLSYVHFPRKTRSQAPERSIHMPEAGTKAWWDISTDFLALAAQLYDKCDRKANQKDQWVANSEFTRQALMTSYGMKEEQIEVVYPPVAISSRTPNRPRQNRMVVSLGRFEEDKRQLEQLAIARALPNFTFHLLGFVNRPYYFQECEAYVQRHGLRNVHLHPNATYSQMQVLLNEAEYFLHSLRNEPFGITAVQAISAGCLPVVHDSGGQREVVPAEQLRYTTEEEAIQRLLHLAQQSESEKNRLQDSLRTGLEKYSFETFRDRVQPMINKVLSQA